MVTSELRAVLRSHFSNVSLALDHSALLPSVYRPVVLLLERNPGQANAVTGTRLWAFVFSLLRTVCLRACSYLRIQPIVFLALSPISRTWRACATITSCPNPLGNRLIQGECVPVSSAIRLRGIVPKTSSIELLRESQSPACLRKNREDKGGAPVPMANSASRQREGSRSVKSEHPRLVPVSAFQCLLIFR